MRRKNIVILGSTGSIGINTLDVIRRYSDRFQVLGLSAYNNVSLFDNQIKEFKPRYVAVQDKGYEFIKSRAPKGTQILDVAHDLGDLVSLPQVDCVVIAMRGAAALLPFLSAIRAGKIICPANKEAIVIAGDIIMAEAKKHKATIIPIDSEQSAIFQCLQGQDKKELKKIHLTASGGPLLHVPKAQFKNLTVERILKHPRWKMGQKITVDSATLINKGFEIIEAKHLFNVEVKDIEVVIHPQAIIHSMVEFNDGSILAQLAVTDMRLPIQFALTYPKRFETSLNPLNFFELKELNFLKPDFVKFPALSLAIHAGEEGGTLPAVLNAADEEAVDAFLNKRIGFEDIFKTVERVVLKHTIVKRPRLSEILEADGWARQQAKHITG
jgi:1-deoxy-D-xylulose-5-phosphate reductoisomerase